jgi:hypothetical protein
MAGQIIRVTCSNVLDYPHDGIVSLAHSSVHSDKDAPQVLHNVRVLHFCRGDPHSSFDDGAGTAARDELRVRETSLAWFCDQGKQPRMVGGPPSAYSPEEVVRRARRYLGASEYDLKRRNFVTHCYYGISRSEAVMRAGYVLAGGVLAAAVCVAGAVLYAAGQMAHTPWA